MKEIGYRMTKTAFNSYLKDRSEADKKKNPYNYVMDCLNREAGLHGKVTYISLSDQ